MCTLFDENRHLTAYFKLLPRVKIYFMIKPHNCENGKKWFSSFRLSMVYTSGFLFFCIRLEDLNFYFNFYSPTKTREGYLSTIMCTNCALLKCQKNGKKKKNRLECKTVVFFVIWNWNIFSILLMNSRRRQNFTP